MLRPMTDLDMWAAIVGFLMPPVVAALVQSAWASWARALFAFGVCTVGGGVTAALTGQMEGVSPARAVLVTLFSALTFYRVFWHPSKIAPMIEKKTNLPEPRPPQGETWDEWVNRTGTLRRDQPPK